MTDDDSKKIRQQVRRSVEIIGLAEVPGAGDIFSAVDDGKMARASWSSSARTRKEEERNKLFHKVTLDNLFDSIQQGEMKSSTSS